MTNLGRSVAVLLLGSLSLCAQTKPHKKAPPKPEPTKPELVEFVRGSLLSLTPVDGINDTLDVSFDSNQNILTVTSASGRCSFTMSALNANTLVWDIFDPSDQFQGRESLLRLTAVSVSGRVARTCYDKNGVLDSTMVGNRARFLFSVSKAEGVPDFQDKMSKALKRLIALSGGSAEKPIYQ